MVATFLELNTFLTETAICSVEREKTSVGHRFVAECNHTQESRACQVFLFFNAIFVRPWFVEIQKFCYHGNAT